MKKLKHTSKLPSLLLILLALSVVSCAGIGGAVKGNYQAVASLYQYNVTLDWSTDVLQDMITNELPTEVNKARVRELRAFITIDLVNFEAEYNGVYLPLVEQWVQSGDLGNKPEALARAEIDVIASGDALMVRARELGYTF